MAQAMLDRARECHGGRTWSVSHGRHPVVENGDENAGQIVTGSMEPPPTAIAPDAAPNSGRTRRSRPAQFGGSYLHYDEAKRIVQAAQIDRRFQILDSFASCNESSNAGDSRITLSLKNESRLNNSDFDLSFLPRTVVLETQGLILMTSPPPTFAC